MMPVVVTLAAYSDTGKTTYLEKLIPRLKTAGLRVAVIKHDGHDFEPDVPGTDSYRHRQAGACGTAVFSDHRFMVIKDQPKASEEKTDEKILIQMFPDVDIILLEGFKHSSWPKYFCRYPEEVPDEEAALKQILNLLNK